VGARMRVRT